MVHEKVNDAALALGGLAGQVSEEQWETIRRVRQELFDAADQALHLERGLEAPQIETCPVEGVRELAEEAG